MEGIVSIEVLTCLNVITRDVQSILLVPVGMALYHEMIHYIIFVITRSVFYPVLVRRYNME